ncbi:MAG: agmatinase family protein [Alphaproteobacteria bacterium]|nr:agmatinase family protein [Alphaproteobacteria bacterium]
MELKGLKLPGLVVNHLKGDPDEVRANGWLEWDGSVDLDAAIIGIPFDGASTVRTGSRHGPDAVRSALAYYTTWSSDARFSMSDLRAADIGDIDVVVTDMAGTFARVKSVIQDLVAGGVVPISIGGDHSIAWPILEGITAARTGRRVGVVHFDAHHDLREAHFGAESSGVPFRKALEFPDDAVAGRNLVQIGMTEFCNSSIHADYAEQMGVTVIPGLQVRRDGIDSVIDIALERAGDGTDGIYVSVDIDCIDQSQAPGTAAPNPCGMDGRDLQHALRRLARDPRVLGCDIVEISPPLDINNMTGNLGAMMVLNFLMGLAMRGAGQGA